MRFALHKSKRGIKLKSPVLQFVWNIRHHLERDRPTVAEQDLGAVELLIGAAAEVQNWWFDKYGHGDGVTLNQHRNIRAIGLLEDQSNRDLEMAHVMRLESDLNYTL